MVDNTTDFFKIKNHFKETEHISSIPIFENKLQEIPKFTIAIPTYKRSVYLREALDSAINQIDSVPYEIIVVDNNPERNDETELCMMHYVNTPNLSYYKNSENIGIAGNWNSLYTLARTEWVIMLHDDDMLLPNLLSFHNEIINSLPDSSVIFPSCYSSYNTPIHIKGIRYKKLVANEFIFGNIVGPPVGMIFKRNDLISLGGFRNYLYPSIDMDIYIRALIANLDCYKIISSSMAFYRFDINESMNPKTIIGYINNQQVMSDILLRKESGLSKVLYKEALKTAIIMQSQKLVRIAKEISPELKTCLSDLKNKQTFLSKIIYHIIKTWNRITSRLKSRYL